MAALDGIVAALEVRVSSLFHVPPFSLCLSVALLWLLLLQLFDILQNSQGVRATVCHIIHIAGAVPDASRHPLWNDSPALDDVSWDTLPLEIKKVRYVAFG